MIANTSAASNELQSEDEATIVTLKDGTTRSFLSMSEAMLWCWDFGVYKVDYFCIAGGKKLTVVDVFTPHE